MIRNTEISGLKGSNLMLVGVCHRSLCGPAHSQLTSPIPAHGLEERDSQGGSGGGRRERP